MSVSLSSANSLLSHLKSVSYFGATVTEGTHLFLYVDTNYIKGFDFLPLKENGLVHVATVNLVSGGYAFPDVRVENLLPSSVIRILQDYQDYIFDSVVLSEKE